MERKPIEWRQLCAIVRTEITADPTIDDLEWSERTKQRLMHLGFDYPSPPHRLNEAMRAVERALTKVWGARPVGLPITPSPALSTKALRSEPPWKRATPTTGKWASMSGLITSLMGSNNSAPSSSALPEACGREVPGVSEPVALALFWDQAEDARTDRLALLQLFAEIAIVRPAEWDLENLRRQFESFSFAEVERCFTCRSGDRTIVRHHVIQLQHGGSNTPRNFVAICTRCHAAVHPWLPKRCEDWTSVADLVASVKSVRAPGVPMKNWVTAGRRLRCGYDSTHAIESGERYLEIEEGGRKRVRCTKCAARHDTPAEVVNVLNAVAADLLSEEVEPADTQEPEPEPEGEPW